MDRRMAFTVAECAVECEAVEVLHRMAWDACTVDILVMALGRMDSRLWASHHHFICTALPAHCRMVHLNLDPVPMVYLHPWGSEDHRSSDSNLVIPMVHRMEDHHRRGVLRLRVTRLRSDTIDSSFILSIYRYSRRVGYLVCRVRPDSDRKSVV